MMLMTCILKASCLNLDESSNILIKTFGGFAHSLEATTGVVISVSARSNPFTLFPFDATYSGLLTTPLNISHMKVDMQITDYQRRIVLLIGANVPQKATYQNTLHCSRTMPTATVTTEASVVYCGGRVAQSWVASSLLFDREPELSLTQSI
jgi:hypothetical protein